MSEVHYGSSPDFSIPKSSRIIEFLKRKFTYTGAKSEWLKKHPERIEKFKAIEGQLSDTDRAKAAEQLAKDIHRGAVVKLGGNYLGLAGVVGAVTIGGRFALDKGFRERSRASFDYYLKIMKQPRETMSGVIARAEQAAGDARARAEELAREARARAQELSQQIRQRKSK